MRKHELVNVGQLLDGLSSKEAWLLIANGSEDGPKCCGKEEAEMLGRHIRHCLAWLLNELVIPLVKVCHRPPQRRTLSNG